MSTISVGEVEAAIRLRDAVTPTVQAVAKAMNGGVGVTTQWTAAQQRAAMAMSGLHEEAVRLNKALDASGMDKLHEEALQLNKTMGSSTGRAGEFAGAVGNVSKKLAGSAEAFGLNAEAFRTLDDVMDVAELGFDGLSKSTAGFNAASAGAAAAGFSVGYMLGGLIRQLPGVAAAADKAAESLFNFFGVATKDSGWKPGELEKIQAAYKGVQENVVESAGGFDQWVKGAISARDNARLLADASELVKRQVTSIDEAKAILKLEEDTKKAAEAQKRLADEAKRVAEEHKRLIDQLARGLSEEGQADKAAGLLSDLDEAIARAGGSAKLSAAEVKNYADKAKEAGEAGRQWIHGLADGTADVPGTILGIRTGFNEALPVVKETADAAKTVHVNLQDAGKAGLSFGASMKGALKDLPNVILGAIQGGGNVFESIGSLFGSKLFSADSSLVKTLGSKLSGLLGDTIGAGLESVIPGLGALIGPLLGGLMDKVRGLFGGLFGDKEIMKVNDMRDAFFEAQGGWEALQKKLHAAGINQDLIKKIFDAKTVEEFNAAVAETMGMLDLQGQAQDKLNAAVDKYGFSIEELGPKMQQQKLHEQALALYEDFRLLTGSGIDVGTVIEKMGPDLIDMVENARKTGQALPEAMKPMIDALIESGQLVDQNGEAYKSAEEAGLTFTQTLEEGLQGAIDAIDRLVAALTGIPPVNIPVNVGPPNGPVPSTGPPPGVPGHASGFYSPGLPGDYTFRAHKGERVEITPAADTPERNAREGGVSLSIGGITVQGASSPEETAQAVVQAIRDNIGGLRTELAYAADGK